ncbi:unnamed protein product [Gemmata massiliana]|uniref:Uncharacterized protein n=1 Tax=Gemmata massiliana TaxID=1210884 RepID=A0A6P2D9Z7_9BACT|nr:hypothetical protein [Gemmata massiliana]VTR96330.1 unnamed protein product [Gemmata massiliana]
MADPLDWSKLPSELSWLAGPAERFGLLQVDDPIHDFLRGLDPVGRDELRTLSEQWGGAWPAVNSWLGEYPTTAHPEARLVYSTGHLLGTGADAGLL